MRVSSMVMIARAHQDREANLQVGEVRLVRFDDCSLAMEP